MKVLFFLLHPGYVRHFVPTLRRLCDDGHEFHLAFNNEKVGAESATLELREGNPLVTMSTDAPRRSDEWAKLSHRIRQMRNYSMYFDPRYAEAHRMRANAEREVYPPDRPIVARFGDPPALRWIFERFLHLAERSIPSDPQIEAYILKHAPDLVLVTPLVTFSSMQVDYIKSARALGIPTGLCVASWDNLSNKGMMRELPDRVIVWNSAQVEEAVTLHRASRNRIVTTGAQSFDHWFEFRPSRSKEHFMRALGLDPGRNLILYLCSSTSISPQELEFIRQWYDAVRSASDQRVAQAAVLVRPHPMNKQPWDTLDELRDPNFVVWPRTFEGLFSPQGRSDYFDSMFHAAAVVGLNTSGQVEAGLIGKPVLTLLLNNVSHTLLGTLDTLHFHHLMNVNGGLLHVARSFEEHCQQLARAIDGDPSMAERSRRFTEAFVRPHGLGRPAAPLLANAILSLAAIKPQRHPIEDNIVAPIFRRVLSEFANRENARHGAKSKTKVRSSSKTV